jgi:hypothetical protein
MRHRSAFLGSVLLTLPMVEILRGKPAQARLDPGYVVRTDVLQEFEHRLSMYAKLLDAGGPIAVTPGVVRELGIYGGASGIWNDVARTRGIGDAASVTVGLLHTGRHYPDDLSDQALTYHYPATSRQAGRDLAEIEATKAAGTLRLPVFVVLQEGATRTIRRGWVVTSDDFDRTFLIEFGPLPARVRRGDEVDDAAFSLFEDREEVMRETRGRPNQQRFRMQVVQRYGARCVLCDSDVKEWIHAAHIAGDAERGSSDPRNGLPFCSNQHAAFDRDLVAIDPSDTAIYVRGYSVQELGITRRDLSHLPAQPAPEALTHRWEQRGEDGWARV